MSVGNFTFHFPSTLMHAFLELLLEITHALPAICHHICPILSEFLF